jgi:anti-sigma regulatory factor (Ser/Thr protein kinase)
VRRGEKLRLPTDPSALGTLRVRLRAWLEAAGAAEGSIRDLVLAADEAAANAIGHSGTRSAFEVELGLDNGHARVVVRDFGRWDETETDPDFGRGLLLIEALTDRCEIAPGPEGTTATLWKRLNGGGGRG